MTDFDADICVIGAGAGGLSVAAGAAQLGAKTILIESGLMGGECLHTGCVPSKSLLAAAEASVFHKRMTAFGLDAAPPKLDPDRLRHHIEDVIAGIAPMDSVERFESLGVRVIKAHARFLDPKTILADGVKIRARRFVLAVGSRPYVPPIPGLGEVGYLTNETIFAKAGELGDLVILGGGAMGMELAQAQARLAQDGARVTILERGSIMPRDDEDAKEILRRRFFEEGIKIREGVEIERVEKTATGCRLYLGGGGARNEGRQQEIIEAQNILVAAGRRPDFADLNLDAAGIEANAKGIVVDQGLRTTNRRVFAVGDCTGHPAFTHIASYQAGIVLRRAIFRMPAKVDYRTLPWVTYTDPELAQIGLIERSARDRSSQDLEIVRVDFTENDRARAARNSEGFIKVVTNKKAEILGITIIGAEAGELLAPWALAMRRRLKLSAMAELLLPYPTRSEISKRAAQQYYAPRLFSPLVRKLARFLLRSFG